VAKKSCLYFFVFSKKLDFAPKAPTASGDQGQPKQNIFFIKQISYL